MAAVMLESGATVRARAIGRGEHVLLVDHPDAPVGIRDIEVGRILHGHYQPTLFLEYTMSPELLRAIAELVDSVAGSDH